MLQTVSQQNAWEKLFQSLSNFFFSRPKDIMYSCHTEQKKVKKGEMNVRFSDGSVAHVGM